MTNPKSKPKGRGGRKPIDFDLNSEEALNDLSEHIAMGLPITEWRVGEKNRPSNKTLYRRIATNKHLAEAVEIGRGACLQRISDQMGEVINQAIEGGDNARTAKEVGELVRAMETRAKLLVPALRKTQSISLSVGNLAEMSDEQIEERMKALMDDRSSTTDEGPEVRTPRPH